MRIAFAGTPEFAVPSLQMLIDKKYDICAVFTQPDRPVGRSGKPSAPPVKKLAIEHGLTVYQCERIRLDGAKMLEEAAPDLMITAAFGQILSKENLDVPRLGCINVHGSLLPKYRGAAPIQWAIINGERETGITTMMTDVGMDTGDILIQKKTLILENETAGELFERLSLIGAQTLIETIELLVDGKLVRTAQDHGAASHFPMLKKEDGKIDFSKGAEEIHCLIRGTNPWPGAFAMHNGKQLKIHCAFVSGESGRAGEVIGFTKRGFLVGCGRKAIEITKLQPQDKKAMDACDFVRGRQINLGDIIA